MLNQSTKTDDTCRTVLLPSLTVRFKLKMTGNQAPKRHKASAARDSPFSGSALVARASSVDRPTMAEATANLQRLSGFQARSNPKSQELVKSAPKLLAGGYKAKGDEGNGFLSYMHERRGG